MTGEAEWKTRKKRIDPKLDAAGWPRPHGKSKLASFRTEEEETDHGPADYALWLGDEMAGVVETKKLTVGPQNVLTQAQRHSRGARRTQTGAGRPSRRCSGTPSRLSGLHLMPATAPCGVGSGHGGSPGSDGHATLGRLRSA